jgi:superfamily I DNA and/or RNA helicase
VEDGKLGIDMLFDDKTYREMEAAVKQIAQADKNRTAELRDILIGKQIANYKKLNFNFENPVLNAKQNLAVQKVLEAQDVAIIHGPPGTGKTTTLVEAIFQTLKTEKQVLVTAASNTAVDLLTEKLVAKGISVVRMGNPARISEQLQACSLDEQIARHSQYKNLKQYRKDADNYRQLARKYKRNFGAAEREQRKLLLQEAKSLLTEAQKIEDYILEQLLSQTQVITATLTGVATQYLKKHQFSTVFIDEAAQALEPACWIPLLKAQRVVMAGDHCQLPPTVKSFEAEKKGLSRTLFEQTIANQQRLQQNVDVMLEVQYRMHKAIMQFANQQFYKNHLQAAESVADKHLSNEPDNPLLYQPFEWIDTAGCGYLEVQDDETDSLKNPEEAELLLVHLQLLWNNLPLDLQQNTDFSIGIISPYKAQVKLLAELVRKLDVGSRVSVNTVDGFQGQERNVIYISMVRSNDAGEIGFLKDTRRMNVAMTRAKQKLVMVGDSSTLSSFAFYEELLRYVEQIEAYRSAWELL